jgi:hypothetical protein
MLAWLAANTSTAVEQVVPDPLERPVRLELVQ